MADSITNQTTSLSGDEVITRAVQFFTSENWRPTGQSARLATFEGKPPIPWFTFLLTIIGFALCVVPGILCYIALIRKARRFVNLVVTANPIPGGTEVSITHPGSAKGLVKKFLASLPGA